MLLPQQEERGGPINPSMTQPPAHATWRTRVRVYECDALGHVNNAVYVCYIQQATVEAWGALAPVSWELRRLIIEYKAPAFSGDELVVVAWVDGSERHEQGPALVPCGYEIRNAVSRDLLVRAHASWICLDRSTGEPRSPVESWPANEPEESVVVERQFPKPLRLPPDRLGARSFRWQHAVRSYELDSRGHVHPVDVLRWIAEAKFVACADVGWPIERMLEEDLVIVQVRHDTEFYVPLALGDRVEIVSRVYDLRRVSGTWQHQVILGRAQGSGECVALDYSMGAFLDRAGNLRPPPQAMLDALMWD